MRPELDVDGQPQPKLPPRFRLDKVIGKGGMGVVYKAYDNELDRCVAVKLLHPLLASDHAAIQRMKREAKLGTRVSHKNVVRIFDFGEFAGAKYLSMEYIDGQPLREIIRKRGPLTPASVIRHASDVCAGMHAIHSQGIIHRDLKPHNVLIDSGGNALVCDFGVAKCSTDDSFGITQPFEVPGTSHYMAPEQRLGLPVDERADIYAFGALLYEMLTGQPPTPEASKADRRLACAKIPAPLVQIILRCLEPEPQNRFISMDDIFPKLQALYSHTAKAKQVTCSAPLHSRRRRISNTTFLGFAAVVLLACIAAVIMTSLPAAWMVSSVEHTPASSELDTTTQLTDSVAAYTLYLKAQKLLTDNAGITTLQEAVKYFEASVKRDPDYVLAYNGMAHASVNLYKRTRDPQWLEKATTAVTRAKSLDGALPQTILTESKLLISKRQFTEAIRRLTRLVSVEPRYGEAHRLLAECYLSEGSEQLALRAAEKSVEMDRAAWTNHATLAAVLVATKQYSEAERVYRTALTLDPSNAVVINNLGAVYLNLGKFREAIPLFEKSLDKCPYAEVYANIGIAYFYCRRYRLAAAMLEKGVALNPESERLAGYLARVYKHAGESMLARQMLDKSISLAIKELRVRSDDNELKARLAFYYTEVGSFTKARQILAELKSTGRVETAQILYTRAMIGLSMGNTAEAVDKLAAALGAGFSPYRAFRDGEWKMLEDNPRYLRLQAEYRISKFQ